MENYDLWDFVNLKTDQKKVIVQLTSIFENSTTELNWGYCENIKDGRGYTCGISGFCSGTGDLVLVFRQYCKLCPDDKMAEELYHILKKTDNDKVKKLKDLPKFFQSNADNKYFREAQLKITNQLYVESANKLAKKYGLVSALSIGQMFDACTNHGEDGAKRIAKKADSKLFKEDPALGFEEFHWLKHFLKERKKVLEKDDTWKEAVDRINVYQELLKEKNYNLKLPINIKAYGDKFYI